MELCTWLCLRSHTISLCLKLEENLKPQCTTPIVQKRYAFSKEIPSTLLQCETGVIEWVFPRLSPLAPRLDLGGRGPPGGGGDGVYTNDHICPLTPPQSCWLLRLRSMVLLHRCLGGLKKSAYSDQAFGRAWRTCLVLMWYRMIVFCWRRLEN
jgi:hypothetical protein